MVQPICLPPFASKDDPERGGFTDQDCFVATPDNSFPNLEIVGNEKVCQPIIKGKAARQKSYITAFNRHDDSNNLGNCITNGYGPVKYKPCTQLCQKDESPPTNVDVYYIVYYVVIKFVSVMLYIYIVSHFR